MSARDPRVVTIAKRLAEACPYGFEHMKVGPSAADYHAALIAVKTLDEGVEYEYAVEWIPKGSDIPVLLTEDRWVPRESAERTIEFNEKMFPDRMEKYTIRLVRRRKAGPVEEVDTGA